MIGASGHTWPTSLRVGLLLMTLATGIQIAVFLPIWLADLAWDVLTGGL